MEIQIEYKGYTLTYSDYLDSWRIEGEGAKGLPLKDQLSRIDKLSKSNFQRYEALLIDRWDNGSLKEVTVTSISEDGDYWITDGKNRRKVLPPNLIRQCPENKVTLALILETATSIKELQDRLDDLYNKLITVSGKIRKEYSRD